MSTSLCVLSIDFFRDILLLYIVVSCILTYPLRIQTRGEDPAIPVPTTVRSATPAIPVSNAVRSAAAVRSTGTICPATTAAIPAEHPSARGETAVAAAAAYPDCEPALGACVTLNHEKLAEKDKGVMASRGAMAFILYSPQQRYRQIASKGS